MAGDATVDVAYSQQVLDVNGKIVVISTDHKSLPNVQHIATQLRSAGAQLVLIMLDGTTVDTLDEDQMRQAGWVRESQS